MNTKKIESHLVERYQVEGWINTYLSPTTEIGYQAPSKT